MDAPKIRFLHHYKTLGGKILSTQDTTDPNNIHEVESPDRNVEAVREKMRHRAKVGLAKYGVTTERGDLSRLDWLRHAQEEAMDLAVYLERLIQMEADKPKSICTTSLIDTAI